MLNIARSLDSTPIWPDLVIIVSFVANLAGKARARHWMRRLRGTRASWANRGEKLLVTYERKRYQPLLSNGVALYVADLRNYRARETVVNVQHWQLKTDKPVSHVLNVSC